MLDHQMCDYSHCMCVYGYTLPVHSSLQADFHLPVKIGASHVGWFTIMLKV